MAEFLDKIPDRELPPEARKRFFCKFQQDTLGVVCEHKRSCDTCGWNPLVQYRRVKIIKERMKDGRYPV